jgi:hypothetical protein
MALNVTKILFRRGTDAQRRPVNFDLGEPAYSTDTKRLFIGDGQTLGGLSLGMRNLGAVASLTGTYLNTNLSTTAFNAITAAAGQIGDIIYDRASSYIWTLTSVSTTPSLSNFVAYAVYPAIDTSDFTYTGVNLTLKNNSIQPKHIRTTCLDGNYFTGGNNAAITLNANAVTNSRLSTMAANTVKANATAAVANPTDIPISTTGTVLGRGAGNIAGIQLLGSNDVKVTASGNTIIFDSLSALKLTGGTMTGNITMGSNVITSTTVPTTQFQLTNKAYVDNLPTVSSAAIVYDFIKSNFLPLSGGTIAGPTALTVNTGIVQTNGEFSNNYNGIGQARFKQGNYGIIHRNDGTNYYILKTTSGDSNGYWDDTRPFAVNLATGNVGLAFNAGSNVGIGTLTPDAMLHINRSNYGVVQLGNNANNQGFTISKESSDNTFNIWTNVVGSGVSRFKIEQDGDITMATNGGSVGIGGAPNASYKLDVAGNIRATGNVYVSMNNATGGGIVLSDDGDIVDLNDGFCSMRFSTGVRVYSGNKSGTPAITLSNAGNITATGSIIAGSYLNAASYGEFGSANVQVGAVAQGLYGDGSNLALRNFSGGGGIYFQSYGGAATHMLIRSGDGNIGIGTGPSGYKLEVNGDVALTNGWLRTRGNNGWFSETYGGGWYMTDGDWIRNYNSKRLYINSPNYSWFDTTGYDVGLLVNNFNNLAIGSDAGRGFPALELISGGTSRGGGACYMNFHRPGAYAVRFGLDTDNKLKVGGWSMGAASYEILHTGNYLNLGLVPIIQTNNIPINRLNSGFYETANAQVSNGWPQSTGGWYHLLANTHHNTLNYYSMQFAGKFDDSNEIFYRATNGSGSTTWNKILHTGNASGVVKRQIIRPDVRSLYRSFLPSVVSNYNNVLCEPLNNYPHLVGGTATIPKEGINIFQGNNQPSVTTYVTKASNSLIHFRMQFQIGWWNAHPISHFRFYVNGNIVDTFSHSINSYGDVFKTYEYWHQSTQAAGTNITWELRGRSYGGQWRCRVHYSGYWDGDNVINTNYVQPTITIEEHVGV